MSGGGGGSSSRGGSGEMVVGVKMAVCCTCIQ